MHTWSKMSKKGINLVLTFSLSTCSIRGEAKLQRADGDIGEGSSRCQKTVSNARLPMRVQGEATIECWLCGQADNKTGTWQPDDYDESLSYCWGRVCVL